jgi:hypothetical protein
MFHPSIPVAKVHDRSNWEDVKVTDVKSYFD